MKLRTFSGKPKAGELPFGFAHFILKMKGKNECPYYLCKGDTLETFINTKYFQIKVNDCTVVLTSLENIDYFLCNFWSANQESKL